MSIDRSTDAFFGAHRRPQPNVDRNHPRRPFSLSTSLPNTHTLQPRHQYHTTHAHAHTRAQTTTTLTLRRRPRSGPRRHSPGCRQVIFSCCVGWGTLALDGFDSIGVRHGGGHAHAWVRRLGLVVIQLACGPHGGGETVAPMRRPPALPSPHLLT